MILIHYGSGRLLEGVVLAFRERAVRVAVKDSTDAVEFRLVNQSWVSEEGEIVTIRLADGLLPEQNDVLELLLESLFHAQVSPHFGRGVM